jgi:hypothetical protein
MPEISRIWGEIARILLEIGAKLPEIARILSEIAGILCEIGAILPEIARILGEIARILTEIARIWAEIARIRTFRVGKRAFRRRKMHRRAVFFLLDFWVFWGAFSSVFWPKMRQNRSNEHEIGQNSSKIMKKNTSKWLLIGQINKLTPKHLKMTRKHLKIPQNTTKYLKNTQKHSKTPKKKRLKNASKTPKTP